MTDSVSKFDSRPHHYMADTFNNLANYLY